MSRTSVSEGESRFLATLGTTSKICRPEPKARDLLLFFMLLLSPVIVSAQQNKDVETTLQDSQRVMLEMAR